MARNRGKMGSTGEKILRFNPSAMEMLKNKIKGLKTVGNGGERGLFYDHPGFCMKSITKYQVYD